MIKRFWQWLGFHVHEWSKWEIQGEISIGPTNKRVIGFWQTRICKTCNKHQLGQVR